MNLKFNTIGDISTDENGLEDVSLFDSEISRFALFFDCVRGGYKYNRQFGNNSDNLVGRSGITPADIQLFNEELNNYLEASNLLMNASVAVDFIDDQTLEVVIVGGGGQTSFRYSTSKGRLYEVAVNDPTTEHSHIIHSEDILITGPTYDISSFINKLKEINLIGKYDVVELSYRVIKLQDDLEGDIVSSTSYYINDFEQTLTLEYDYLQGDRIRLQGWPTETSSIESTTNPYLMRRNL